MTIILIHDFFRLFVPVKIKHTNRKMAFKKISEKISCRALIVILLASLSCSEMYGQEVKNDSKNEIYPYPEEKSTAPSINQRLFFGGYLGLQFGTVTNIQIAPVVGFWVLPRLAVAAGPSYQYYKDSYYDYTSNIYGLKSYAEFVVIQNINRNSPSNTSIFLHLEDDLLNMESSVLLNSNLSGRSTVNTVLGGVGISQQIGMRSSVNFMILWSLYDKYGIYSNPEIRLSFSF